MSKEQLIADAKVALSAAQDGVLGDLVDKAQAEVPPADNGPSEADIQARIDAALAAQAAADAQALADAKAQGDAAIAVIQAQLDALSLKEGQEASVIAGLQSSIVSIQGALDALHALFP